MRREPQAADVQRSYYRCTACRTRFGVDMLVNVPVDQFLSQMQAIRCPECGSTRIAMGESRTLAEDLEVRIQGDVHARLRNWREKGERGISSDAIASHMTGGASGRMDAPHDLDDVRRCILLLGHVPEWRDRMPEMASHPEWERIAPRWAELERAYLSDSPGLDGGSPAAAAIMDALR